MRLRRHTVRARLFIVLVLTVLIAGCNPAQNTTGGTPKTLRVLGDAYFLDLYNAVFAVTHPDAEIEFIDINRAREDAFQAFQRDAANNPGGETSGPGAFNELKLYEQLLSGPEAPDVVVLNSDLLASLSQSGFLAPLDGYVEKDKFPLDRLAPSLVEALRDLGDGTLYGLAPTFNAVALAYNKDRFDELNLPYPTDDMTWSELFDLAESLTGEKNGQPVAGLSIGSLGDLLNFAEFLLQQKGVRLLSDDGKPQPIDTPERRDVWTNVVDLERRGVITRPYYERLEEMNKQGATGGAKVIPRMHPFEDDDLLSGRAAMKFVRPTDLDQLQGVLSGRYNFMFNDETWQPPSFAWDIAAVPVDPDHPDVGGPVDIYQIFAVNANSAQPELAWTYIREAMSEKVAKSLRTKSYMSELNAYVDFNKRPEFADIHFDAFWLRKPPSPVGQYQEQYYQIQSILRSAMDQVRRQNASVDEALRQAEQNVQATPGGGSR
ncbi:MAG: extracellular solute-binding protein [Hydrogenibacillus sp.]|nr:extracellular solute-binding protein [Hydrogenibacillus sp.]